MSRRHYINNAAVTSLTGSLTSGATSFAVADLSTYPASLPYLVVIDAGLSTAEVVLVTAVTGNTVTACTRGYDGTAAQAHAASAVVEHVASAMDYDEANAHVNASTGVHGLAGTVVGTSDAQNLTNKTITSPAFAGSATGNLTTSGNLQGAAVTATGNASVGGTLSVTGNATLGGTVAASGQVTAPSKVAPNETFQFTASANSVLNLSGAIWVSAQVSMNVDNNSLGAAADGAGGTFVGCTIPAGKGGKYRINGQVATTMNAGRIQAGATKNTSSNWVFSTTLPASPSGTSTTPFGPYEVTLAAGDQLRLLVSPSDPGNYGILAGTGNVPQTFMRVERLA